MKSPWKPAWRRGGEEEDHRGEEEDHRGDEKDGRPKQSPRPAPSLPALRGTPCRGRGEAASGAKDTETPSQAES